MKWIITLLFTTLVGCSPVQDIGIQPQEKWFDQGIKNYTFQIESGFYCYGDTYSVTVQNYLVSEAVNVETLEVVDFETSLSNLVAVSNNVLTNPVYWAVDVVWNEEFGYPEYLTYTATWGGTGIYKVEATVTNFQPL